MRAFSPLFLRVLNVKSLKARECEILLVLAKHKIPLQRLNNAINHKKQSFFCNLSCKDTHTTPCNLTLKRSSWNLARISKATNAA